MKVQQICQWSRFSINSWALFQYVRLADDSDMNHVLELIRDYWKMVEPVKPSLVITVIGGAKNFELDHKKKDMFIRGLLNVWCISFFFWKIPLVLEAPPLTVLLCLLTRWPWRTRCLVLLQYCLDAMFELTCTSYNCGQRLPSIQINFNARVLAVYIGAALYRICTKLINCTALNVLSFWGGWYLYMRVVCESGYKMSSFKSCFSPTFLPIHSCQVIPESNFGL